MANHFQFRELARLLCEIDGRTTPADVEAVTQQIRGAQQRGILSPLAATGPRGALLIAGKYEPCLARLVQVMLDMGMRADALKAAVAFLKADDAQTDQPRRNLWAAVDAIASGERVHLVVTASLARSGTSHTVRFAREYELGSALPVRGGGAGSAMGCWVIPITDLLAPLVGRLAELAQAKEPLGGI